VDTLTSSPNLGFLLLVAFAVTMLVVILARIPRRPGNRAILKTEAKRLRLYKMLSYLGVPVDRYFKILPEETIARHLVNCIQCSQTERAETCDACLDGKKQVRNMNFCANYHSLNRLSDKFREDSNGR
jgi:recombinational DNA repair protein RecR